MWNICDGLHTILNAPEAYQAAAPVYRVARNPHDCEKTRLPIHSMGTMTLTKLHSSIKTWVEASEKRRLKNVEERKRTGRRGGRGGRAGGYQYRYTRDTRRRDADDSRSRQFRSDQQRRDQNGQ